MAVLTLKEIGGGLLATALVWGLMLGWWLSNGLQPTPAELLVDLGVLPLSLIGGYLLLRGVTGPRLGPLPGAARALSPAGAARLPQGAEAIRQPAAEGAAALCLLDAFMVAPGGRSGAALLSAIESGRRAGGRRVSGDGCPAWAAEVEGLDVEAFAERLQGGLPAQEAWLASDELLRSLALLDGVLREAIPRLEGLLGVSGPPLRCVCLVPAHWETAHYPWLHSWLRRTYLAGFAPGCCELSLVPVADGPAALAYFDELCLALNREPHAERLVLLASAVSTLDRRVLAGWAARHPGGRVPGECAAALLLARAGLVPQLPVLPDAVVQIGRRASSLRIGGGDVRCPGSPVGEALAAWQHEGSPLSALVCDGEGPTADGAAIPDALAAALAHLDPLEDCFAAGRVVGLAPPASALVALACAASRARAAAGPVLCLSTQHEHRWAALPVRPLAMASPAAPLRT